MILEHNLGFQQVLNSWLVYSINAEIDMWYTSVSLELKMRLELGPVMISVCQLRNKVQIQEFGSNLGKNTDLGA